MTIPGASDKEQINAAEYGIFVLSNPGVQGPILF
jgi:hypothetical protein